MLMLTQIDRRSTISVESRHANSFLTQWSVDESPHDGEVSHTLLLEFTQTKSRRCLVGDGWLTCVLCLQLF